MNKAKSIRDSLLSVLCIISWMVIIFRIFTNPNAIDNTLMEKFIWTWIITISIGIVGGICLHFYCIIKRRILNQHFIYNLFATSNILIGSLGMMLPPIPGKPTPYLIAASLTVGIVMYKTIFIKTKWLIIK